MAIKTVSATGGTFTATGTWVGGVAPVAGDGIVANATSGNLTLGANTVSLISADFTGYTGTLALGSNQMVFNTAGTVFLTIGSGMTITYTSGYFRVQQAATITSNAKTIPISLNSAGATFTLVGDLTASLLQNAQGTVTGADLIMTDTAPPVLSSLIMNTGYKFYIRPSGSLTLDTSGMPRGYVVFDTTNQITLGAPLQLEPNTAGAITQTIEFGKTASWTGTGAPSGRPNLMYNLTGSWSGSTFGIVSTANNNINEVMAYMASSASINLSLTGKLILDTLTVLSVPGTSKATLSVIGSGGFIASNVYVDNSKLVNGNTFVLNTAALKLTSDGTYSIGNLLVSGVTASGNSILSSLTASVPATVSITSGAYAYAQITDINNVGTTQYVLTQNGNTLLRTTGFSATTPSGVGGGSFTYVN